MSTEKSDDPSSWEEVWQRSREGTDDFYSLLGRRYVWPYEGFIVSVSRLLRAGEVDLEATRVLDFGCGQGRHVIFFARSGFRKVTGVDIASTAIEAAGAWVASEGLEASLRVADGGKLPFEDASFDLVTCFGVLHHVPTEQLPEVAAELTRVVAPGGHLLLAEFSHHGTVVLPGPRLGPRSYRIDLPDDPEHGQVQHHFSLQDLVTLLPGFRFQIGATERQDGAGPDTVMAMWNLTGTRLEG
jgi:ubiquinone/menaquinone biosynthesis C-methylase UbiE